MRRQTPSWKIRYHLQYILTLGGFAVLAGSALLRAHVTIPDNVLRPLLFIGIGLFIAGGLLLAYNAGDDELRKAAAEGRAILLTADEYMTFHTADPLNYPLNPGLIRDMGTSTYAANRIKMLASERNKLRHLLMQIEDGETMASARQTTLRQLLSLQLTLSAYVEKQKKLAEQDAKQKEQR